MIFGVYAAASVLLFMAYKKVSTTRLLSLRYCLNNGLPSRRPPPTDIFVEAGIEPPSQLREASGKRTGTLP
jgi:hypothetical protein